MKTLAASVLALTFCATPALAEPAMWKVSDADSSVHLFGSIHLFTRPMDWRTPIFDAEVKSAEHVYFEVLLDATAYAVIGRAMLLEGRLRDGRTLWDLLTPEQSDELREAVTAAGLDAVTFERMTPWMAELMLSSALLQGAEAGVEVTLYAEVEAERQRALETVEEQLGFMSRGTEAQQVENLMLSVRQFGQPGATESVDQMMVAWERGDTDLLHQMNSAADAFSPERYEVLIVDRNLRWVPEIERMLADNEDALIVVGAGHLVGPDGVPTLLEERGYTVELVSEAPAPAPAVRKGRTDRPAADPRKTR